VTRELKSIISGMHLRPPPLIIDVDARDDAEVLAPMLTRLTQSPDLPILLIAGKPVGTISQILEMLVNGELQRLITSSGAVMENKKGKKERRRK
jgi:glutaredoxin-related protein